MERPYLVDFMLNAAVLHNIFRRLEIISNLLERFQQKIIYIEMEVYYNSL